MKIFFINNGMTHYYNLVLNRLNKIPGISLILVVPDAVSKNIGAGVYQSREGVNFKVYELREVNRFGLYSSFRGLAGLLREEKPDVIIVTEVHLLTFLLNFPVIFIRRLLGIKVILKSIPFRLPKYDDKKAEIGIQSKGFRMFPAWVNSVLLRLDLLKIIRLSFLQMKRVIYNIPDAHVNYIDDAYEIYGSYGVKKERIFITRNSPDTDMLFEVRESLKSTPPILPPCEFRLIHVGRLIEWKRVDLLLKAFSRINKEFKEAELLIIGKGPEEKVLRSLSQQLGFEGDAVRFLGGVYDPKALGRYFIDSSIYVLAGMGGLSINEAMCFGLPVICSVCDGTEKKLVRNEYNGLYFKEGDENDLAEKITYLFNNPDLRKEMGIRSSEIIQNEINIQTVINGYLKAFKYICPDKLN